MQGLNTEMQGLNAIVVTCDTINRVLDFMQKLSIVTPVKKTENINVGAYSLRAFQICDLTNEQATLIQNRLKRYKNIQFHTCYIQVPYTIFEQGNYVETVTKEENGVRLVDCATLGINNLYRIEYGPNYQYHTVRYSPEEALAAFSNHSHS